MTVFDFQWQIEWQKEGEGRAFTADGTPVGIHLAKTLTSEWVWLDSTPQAERIPRNEGDGFKGRYHRLRGVYSGNLEIRMVPSLDDWRNKNFTSEWGFVLPELLAPHIGDIIYFKSVLVGTLYKKGTSLEAFDYPRLSMEEAETLPYAGIDVLSCKVKPAEMTQIWDDMTTKVEEREAKQAPATVTNPNLDEPDSG